MGIAGIVSSTAIFGSKCAHLLPLRSTRTIQIPLSILTLSPSQLFASSHLQHKNPTLRKFTIRAARTESKGVSLGFRAPDFQLPEPLTGKMWKLDDFESYPALLVMFICNHCPFVKHLEKDIVKLANFYMKKGLAVVAISSNSIITHPQDGPDFMAEEAKLFNYPFPYLYDETQDIARAFRAVCTPEFFLFKKDGRRPFELFYHGQFDDSRPSNNVRITGRDLSLAIDCVLSGQPLSSPQKPRFSFLGFIVYCWLCFLEDLAICC
ncbi:thioredoxin superfamily protein isoform X2 [Tasmannia lanceolata]|uniref:thioredoxin superfamily protein isoform X2 n=1 Tax=Tasmannia lanceolata TaxID=3420 RepID=UPI0040627DC2